MFQDFNKLKVDPSPFFYNDFSDVLRESVKNLKRNCVSQALITKTSAFNRTSYKSMFMRFFNEFFKISTRFLRLSFARLTNLLAALRLAISCRVIIYFRSTHYCFSLNSSKQMLHNGRARNDEGNFPCYPPVFVKCRGNFA